MASEDHTVESLKKDDPKLTRTLSVNSLISTDSFSKLFNKNKNKNKRSRFEDSDLDDSETLTNESLTSHSIKRQKLEEIEKNEKEKLFLENEKKLDAEIPAEYRKFRPKGFSFNLPPKDRPIRIYADGVFDLFHVGHMRQLEQCKKSFPNVELVVGIPSDAVTHKLKGLTVLTDKQRYESLRHCKWVDEVIEDAPWILTLEFLKKHKIDYCAHDDLPYAANGIGDIYQPMKKAGMFLATQRTEGISTSDIITKIIRDYDKYLMRNFARGATRKELNVSWLKKNELDLKKQINDFRSYWKKTNMTLNNASRDLYFEVREMLRGQQRKRGKLRSLADEKKKLQTPADKFASRYNGNGLGAATPMNKRSIIDNFKGWVSGVDSHSELDSNNEDEYDDYDTSDEYHEDESKQASKANSDEEDEDNNNNNNNNNSEQDDDEDEFESASNSENSEYHETSPEVEDTKTDEKDEVVESVPVRKSKRTKV